MVPILAKGKILVPFPIVVCPSMCTFEINSTLSPKSTKSPILQKGPILTFFPILVFLEIILEPCIIFYLL